MVTDTGLSIEFERARYNGVLAVMKGDRKRYNELEKKYKGVVSELNILKIKYLELQENYIKKVYGDV